MALGAVVDHHDAESPLIVARGDCLKTLLPCGVPQLQLDSLISCLQHFDLEVYADCGHVVLRKLVLRKTHEKACFPHTTISNQHKLY